MTRRHILKLLLASAALRCATREEVDTVGRLAARPAKPTRVGKVGTAEPLGLGAARDGIVYAAPAADGAPRPLLLLLHGASGAGARIFARLQPELDAVPGIVVLAPDSRGLTWDVAREGLGPDVRFIDRALREVFDRYAVDRVAVAGFSDGASYALTLGLTNGDLFAHAIAFSPGFLELTAPSKRKPRVFIAHGRDDDILPFNTRIADELRQSGYDVDFHPFDGGHTPRADIVRAAMQWWRLPASK